MVMSLTDKLLAAGCEEFKYKDQPQRFIGKEFNSRRLALAIGLDNLGFDPVDFLEEIVEDESAVVEYCVEDHRIQYFINFGCWDNVDLDTDLGKKLIEILLC